jgi:PglZ domain
VTTVEAVPAPVTTGLGGPVSAALEADLRLAVLRNGIVVWLDQAGDYTGFAERLRALRATGALPYQVHAFRGSHLALMLELDGVAAGTEEVPLVIHLPGLTREAMRATPLLELVAVGTEYRKALATLVTEAAAGQVRPDQIEAFKGQPGLTLAGADAWLAALLDGATGGLDAQLRVMSPAGVLDDLLTGGPLARRISDPETADALWERFAAWTGLTEGWREATLPAGRPGAEDVAFAAAGWALCAEYADDLRCAPAGDHLASAVTLPRPVTDACRAVAAHLRERHPDFYKRTADEAEALLGEEVERARAEDFGAAGTFRFAERKILRAALAALGNEAYDQAAAWADPRVAPGPTGASFWLRGDPALQSAWQLIREAARLGQAIGRVGAQTGADPTADDPLAAAVTAYTERGAAVDQAHRLMEQARVALLYPLLPEFETLRARLDGMRVAWRTWADGWAREFSSLCTARGFLPGTALQQRTLFDDVVRPLAAEPGTTAYFVVDALRFEMGEELFRQMAATPATTATLRPRLAELPTVTAVGMNALAPVARNGRLQVALAGDTGAVLGFQAGEYRVHDPETRRRAMHDRAGGATCPWLTLDEVVSRDVASMRRSVAQARLVVVHSREIDEAGEKGVGPAVFDLVLQKLRAAWRVLREAGVRRFVFTADHGFLLLDDDPAAVQVRGRRADPQRRHVFSPVAADRAGEVRVALTDLRYEGSGTNVIFPESTTVFDTGRRGVGFAHGGNSLQERVIPVLTVVHRTAAGGNGVRYGVTARAREGVAGMHCVEATVEVLAQQSLDFGGVKEIELALRVPDADGVLVELCQARGRARIAGSVVAATVGEPFEIFFRLSGTTDVRALVEIYHPSAVADVAPGTPDARFAVTATRTPAPTSAESTPAPVPSGPAPAASGPAAGAQWLEQFPDPGVRQVFEHLAAHGAVTEAEATAMLGGPRGLRRFTLQFETHAQKAPFAVHIDVVAGVKRYVREGSG